MKIFIFISFIILNYNYCFNESEQDFVSALSKELAITHIVMVNKTSEIFNKILELKNYSLKYINVAYMNFSELVKFFDSANSSNINIMIIFKIVSNEELQSLSQRLGNKFEQIRKLSAFKWLLLLPQNKEITVTEKDFYVPFNFRFFLSRETDKGYEIFQLYQRKKTSNMIYTYFGAWDKVYGLEIITTYFYNERKDMQGTPLTISHYLPGTTCTFVTLCIHFEIIHDFVKIFNFTEMFIYDPGKKVNADVMALNQMFSYHNPNYEDAVGPVTVARMHFYIQHELSSTHRWLSYFEPFNRNLWLATVSCLIIASLIKVIIGYVTSVTIKQQNHTWLDQWFAPLTIFSCQGINWELNTISSRIAVISTFIASIIIVSAYSAAVILSLTIQKPNIPFTSFQTLIEDGTYNLLGQYSPNIYLFFKESRDPTMTVLREKHLLPYEEFCVKIEDCSELICKDKKLSIAAYNYKLTQYPTKCHIFRIPMKIIDFYTAIELKDGVSYRRILIEAMLKIRTSGVLYRYQKIIFGETESPIEEKVDVIDVNAVKFAFTILLLGILIFWILLLCEILWYNCKRFRKMHIRRKSETFLRKI